MYINLSTPSLTLDVQIDHVSLGEISDESKQLGWQVSSTEVSNKQRTTSISSQPRISHGASKLLTDTKLAGVVTNDSGAVKLETILELLNSTSIHSYETGTYKHQGQHPPPPTKAIAAIGPRRVSDQQKTNHTTTTSSSSSSIASKSTLVGRASSEHSTEPRSSLSQSIETSNRLLFASDPPRYSTGTTSSRIGKYQPETSLTKVQQRYRRVKEVLCPSWVSDRTASSARKSNITLFALRRHPQYPEVLEVVDCKNQTVAYRKISRGGKSWRETFHSAAPLRKEQGPCSEVFGSAGDTRTGGRMPPASMMHRTESFVGSGCWSMESRTSRNILSVDSSTSRMHPPVPPLQALASTSGISCWWRQQWHPRAFDLHELWEVTSPRPNSFPLHCRDARGVISPVPLTPMVLDRHQFCYRFHLAGNKMRWLAKRQGRYIKGLQCYVRGTAVAFLLFGECSADGSNGLGGGSWSQDEKQYAHLPQIVVLPEALHKLDPIDPAIVESFVLFTGIEVFECFMYDI